MGARRRWAAAVAGVAAAALAVALPGRAAAQEVPLSVTATDLTAHPTVEVTVAVPTVLAGKDLPSTAFTVTENGLPVQANAWRLPGDELEVVLVIDTSGSMQGAPIEAAKAAATSFLTAIPDPTRVAVVGFGTRAGVVSPFTSDHNATRKAVQALRVGGETALYDAVGVAVNQFSKGPDVRRELVVLSDGGDTASTTKLEAAIAHLWHAGAHATVIGLQTGETDPGVLGLLAGAANGRTLTADLASLDAVFRSLAVDFSSQHRLTWESASHNGTDVVIELRHETLLAKTSLRLNMPAPEAAVPEPGAAEAVNRPPVEEPSRTLLTVGSAAFFVAFLVLALMAILVERKRRAADMLVSVVRANGSGKNMLQRFGDAASVAMERLLEQWGRRRSLNTLLEEAGLVLRPGEFGVVLLSGTLAVLLLGLMFFGLAGAFFGMLLGPLGAYGTLSFLARRRRSAFSDQLGDTLQLLASSLRAGYALMQAVDAVAREAESPTSDEFRRLVIETRLGRDLAESLRAMADRVGGDDFEWVVQAIEINREVGGDLAEVLDNVGNTIRERNQLRRHVKALTAEGRLSAYILVALPFVLALALKFINPDYFVELTRGTGIALVGAAGIFMLVGSIWLKKLVKLVY